MKVNKNKAVEKILSDGPSWVIMDIGASGGMHAPFKALERYATLIEFDPDERDFNPDSQTKKRVKVPRVVCDDPDKDEVKLYLTSSPHCTSTLRPLDQNASEWVYGPSFQPERVVTVAATTINKVLADLGHRRLDWLKLDTQGTDGRILKSIAGPLFDTLSVVEAEPGYCDHYEGADTFGEIHQFMLSKGFFLAEMNNQRQIRMRPESYARLLGEVDGIKEKFLKKSLATCPTAPELTYIRTINSANQLRYTTEQWQTLWVSAVLLDKLEYAYDLACEVSTKDQEIGGHLITLTRDFILNRSLQEVPKSLASYFREKIS